jgi:hypothetical protein
VKVSFFRKYRSLESRTFLYNMVDRVAPSSGRESCTFPCKLLVVERIAPSFVNPVVEKVAPSFANLAVLRAAPSFATRVVEKVAPSLSNLPVGGIAPSFGTAWKVKKGIIRTFDNFESEIWIMRGIDYSSQVSGYL